MAYILKPDQVQEIRALKGWLRQPRIAKLYGIATSTVGRIQQGHLWESLPKERNEAKVARRNAALTRFGIPYSTRHLSKSMPNLSGSAAVE
jgi:hypothetical protein